VPGGDEKQKGRAICPAFDQELLADASTSVVIEASFV
jgi:hypothetical protein